MASACASPAACCLACRLLPRLPPAPLIFSEEILNPSVPMALRPSGILMGGVVIVYERKVNLLYNDVNRALVEINETWKAKAKVVRTVLSQSKAQAKFEAVTLPMAVDMEIEQSMNFSNAANNFQRMSQQSMGSV